MKKSTQIFTMIVAVAIGLASGLAVNLKRESEKAYYAGYERCMYDVREHGLSEVSRMNRDPQYLDIE